jgi:hypothetical protein
MNSATKALVWIGVAALGAFAFAMIALARGETIGAAWIVIAGVCSYVIAYRFYARFIAYRVMGLDPRRATPAERLDNGRDFVPTSRWVLYGHHFSAISGAGPLVGPTLAAQFGFLPGTMWLIAGVIFGGAVQDFVILAASMRRDGKSLGQMARAKRRRCDATTASTTCPPIAGSCSATTSPRSPAQDPWWARCSPRRWATCPACCGCSSGCCSPGRCRISWCCSCRCAATRARSAR